MLRPFLMPTETSSRQVPRPLAALVAATLLLGFAWALFLPGDQAPDEPSHIAYAQRLAETGHRPSVHGHDPEAGFSGQQQLARHLSHLPWVIQTPSMKPEWRDSVERRWRRGDAALGSGARSNSTGPNTAGGNPPLYYAYVAIAYRASGGSFFGRVYAMRLWSVLLLGLGVVATWLLAGELTGRDRLSQLVASACVGLQPMATFISGSVNPDGALIPLWALVFWLGARVLKRGATRGSVAALVGATGLALLVKASSFALLPAVALVLAIAARRSWGDRRIDWRRTAPAVAVGGAILLAAGIVGAGRVTEQLSAGRGSIRGFLSYLWQAYLPNLPFQTPVRNLAGIEGYDIWIKTGWASFGWLEVQFPRSVYLLLAAISAIVIAGGLAAVWKGRFPVPVPVLAFFAVAIVGLLAGLHWAEYRQYTSQHLSFIQGRYLLPLLPLGGLLTASVIRWLPARRRGVAAAAVLGGLFMLQVFSLGLLAGRFYA
jgi:4-amino-4-deoxy-L-arabinose transferase-like glycosyltransferase